MKNKISAELQKASNQHYYNRLSMALEDISSCQRYCEIMLELSAGEAFSDKRMIYEALFVSFVVSYGRVFSTSKALESNSAQKASNQFGKFRANLIEMLEGRFKRLHNRIMDKRDTTVAHSDVSSRDYQYYSDYPIGVGRNPYYPYDHEEVGWAIEWVEILRSKIGDEQSRVGVFLFSKQIFQN